MATKGSFDRREFIASATAASVAGLVLSEGSFAESPKETQHPFAGRAGNVESFLKCVGTSFWIDRPGDKSLRVTLQDAKPYRLGKKAPRHLQSIETFSLIFRAAKGAELEDGIRRVRHAHLPSMEIFLQRVGADHEYQEIQAVFG